MKIKRQHKHAKGFTLLEAVLALFIIGLLSTSIIISFRTTVNFSTALLDKQEKSLHDKQVEQHVKWHLLDITNDTKFELYFDEAAQIQTLFVYDAAHYFPHQGKDTLARKTVFHLQPNNLGLYDLYQLSYAVVEDEELVDDDGPHDKETKLINNLQWLQWHFYDDRYEDPWNWEWDREEGIPPRIRLTYLRVSETKPTTKIFWMPPNLRK